jgi:hypothetical protein
MREGVSGESHLDFTSKHQVTTSRVETNFGSTPPFGVASE